jgi:hypothetical protein
MQDTLGEVDLWLSHTDYEAMPDTATISQPAQKMETDEPREKSKSGGSKKKSKSKEKTSNKVLH